jgi:hypothetical protein
VKFRRSIILALLCASTTAYAQGGSNSNNGPSPYDGRRAVAARSYPAPVTPEGYGRVIHKANDCAPDRAEPVWGAGSALLGYSCETPSAN